MKKLLCTIYNHDGKIMESYCYNANAADKAQLEEQAKVDINLKHAGKWSRFTLIEIGEVKAFRVTDTMFQKGQLYSNLK